MVTNILSISYNVFRSLLYQGREKSGLCSKGLNDNMCTYFLFQCTVYNPCFSARCINTVPGYQCLECPEGYSGTFEDAYAWTVHQRVFLLENAVYSNYTNQTCEDIDECAINHGGCDLLMPCVNTAVSIYVRYNASHQSGK